MRDFAEPGAGRRTIGRGEIVPLAALLILYWLGFQFVFFTYDALNTGHVMGPVTLLSKLFWFILRPIELMVVFAGAALCIALYLGARALRERPMWLQLPASGIATLVGALLFVFVVRLALDLYGVPKPALTPANIVLDMMRWIAPLGLWTAIALALVYNRQVREREARLAALSVQAHQAQVMALRYQVNPHFLYNTLNSISALILEGRNALAETMVMRLSNFFRASLAIDPFEDVPLARELALQRLYLDIELVRFETLSVRVDLPAELDQALVPSLILQPLVENALKYGVNDAPQPTLLAISARREGERLVLEVSDDGPGVAEGEGTGVGLGNVRRRLEARFGDAARVETHSAPGKGFTARLILPLVVAPSSPERGGEA
jgi:sensor histidine kinase YesM